MLYPKGCILSGDDERIFLYRYGEVADVRQVRRVGFLHFFQFLRRHPLVDGITVDVNSSCPHSQVDEELHRVAADGE